jgi:hypothetical protein
VGGVGGVVNVPPLTFQPFSEYKESALKTHFYFFNPLPGTRSITVVAFSMPYHCPNSVLGKQTKPPYKSIRKRTAHALVYEQCSYCSQKLAQNMLK